MNRPLISLQNLCFAYPNSPLILEKVNLSINPGDFIGVIGPNGGGKTTLLRLLAGFLLPSKGAIHQKPSLSIGYVPQVPKLDRDFPITTFSFILTGIVSQSLWFGKYPKKWLEKAESLLDKLGLAEHRNKPIGSLSGGLLQKTLIGKALLSEPDLLLLDEPTSNVDAKAKQDIFAILESFSKERALLMVTHDWKVATDHFKNFWCVNKNVSQISKEKLCEHFTLGLYHPLEGSS